MPVRRGHEGERQNERERDGQRGGRAAAEKMAAYDEQHDGKANGAAARLGRDHGADHQHHTTPGRQAPHDSRRAQGQRGGQRQHRDHVQREIVRIPEHPADDSADAPALDHVDAVGVVKTARKPMYPLARTINHMN